MFAPKVAKQQTGDDSRRTLADGPSPVESPLSCNVHGQIRSGSKEEISHGSIPAGQTHPASRSFPSIPILPADRPIPLQRSSSLKIPFDWSNDSAQTAAELQTPPLFGRSASPRDVRSVVNEPGQPLHKTALSDFQSTLGHDFSTVRVHSDDRAAASAASLAARAYTLGHHIVFARGEYAPETSTGHHLLGHELAHVVQQSRGGPNASSTKDRSLEAAADHAADHASHGIPVSVAGNSAVAVACKTLFEEFTAGKYAWGLLEGALKYTRPIASIVDDLKALTDPEREQAITDMTQERVKRACKQAFQAGQQSVLTDPADRAIFDPMLAEGKRVLDRFDAVLDGVAPAGTVRTQIPGWNFTPEDYAQLRGAKKDLTIAPDSNWFPAKLQDNLLKTLAFVLGPTVPVAVTPPWSTPALSFCEAARISPPATEGVNALDFFHGHLVVKKEPATDTEARAAVKAAERFSKDLEKARKKAIGEVGFTKGYSMTDKKIADYSEALEKLEPSLASIMNSTSSIPGAALMYHTFEFNNPNDLKTKGQKLDPTNPRRHYVTPLDTNTPQQYTPPAGGYETEFTHVTKFAFLVDTQGAVHVRPLDTGTGLTTLELSTITKTPFPEPLEFEK